MSYKPQPALKTGTPGAIDDIVRGVKGVRVWNAMALNEIKRRYRRSIIGPFWLTLTMGITVAGLGLLWGQLFKIDLAEYLPYLTIGFIIWGFLSTSVVETTNAFIGSAAMIKQSSMPMVFHIFQVISTNFLIFLHNFVIYIAVALIFDSPIGPLWLVSMVSLLICFFAITGLGLFAATVSARFRDFPVIITNVMTLLFFMTPVIWKPTMLPERALFLEANPFYYLIEIFRQPLLGTLPELRIWIGALVFMTACMILGTYTFIRYRRKLAYWL